MPKITTKRCPFCESEIAQSEWQCPNCGAILSEKPPQEDIKDDSKSLEPDQNTLKSDPAKIEEGQMVQIADSETGSQQEQSTKNIDAAVPVQNPHQEEAIEADLPSKDEGQTDEASSEYNYYKKSMNQPQEERIDGFLISDIEAFVGSSKYTNTFKRISSKRITINFPTLIAPAAWFGYRGMWKWVILASLIQTGTTAVMDLITVLFVANNNSLYKYFGVASFVVFFSVSIAVSLIANKVYFKYVKEELGAKGCLNRQPEENEELTETLEDQGRPNIVSGIAGFLIQVLIGNLLDFAVNYVTKLIVK